jgi:hypothetical protein
MSPPIEPVDSADTARQFYVNIVLTSRVVKVVLTVEIVGSAHRHAVGDDDINHAWHHAIRLIEYEYDGQERLLIIGPDRHGRLLELVAIPADEPTRIIHADKLRRKFHHYLS